MCLTPGKPNSLSPKPLSGGIPKPFSGGVSKDLCSGASKSLSPGGLKHLSSGGSKDLFAGGSKYLASGDSKGLSSADSKDLSSGVSKSLSRGGPNPFAGQNVAQSTQTLSPGLSKGTLSISFRGNKGNSPSQDSKPDSEILSTALAIRPGVGNAGEQINVETNHFKLDVTKVDDIYLHSVTVTARYERKVGKRDNGEYNTEKVDVTPKKIRRILAQLFENNPNDFQKAAADYAGKVVSLNRIVSDLSSKSYDFEYYEVDEKAPAHGVSKRPYTVCVQHYKTVKASLYLRNLAQTENTAVNDDKVAVLDALNLMISRYPSEHAGNVVVGGTRHFNRVSPSGDYEDLTQGLRGWAGYERSVRGSSEGLLLQINCGVSAFYATPAVKDYPNGRHTLDYLIHEWSVWDSRKQPNRDPYEAKEAYQDTNREELERFIRGMRVRATYGTNLPYTVCSLAESSVSSISRPMPGNVKFSKKFLKTKGEKKTVGNGPWIKTPSSPGLVTKASSRKNVANPGDEDLEERLISVRDHLHSLSPPVDVTYHTGLVINVGSKTRPICIPAEFLRFEPGTSFRRLLNPDQTQKMVRFASMTPQKTKEMIASTGLAMFGIQKTLQNSSPDPRFGMMITTSMLHIKARILQRPTLMYNKKPFRLPNNTGQWLLKNLSLHKKGKVPTWTLVQFRDGTSGWCDDDALKDFHKELKAKLGEYCSAAGREVELSEQKYALTGRATLRKDVEEMLKNVATENSKRVMTPKISVVFVILPNKSAVNYETLKHLAETKYGLHTICTVRQGRVLKFKADFFTNLMLKCNLKMGGSNTSLQMIKAEEMDIKDLIIGTNTMIVGADVTHAGAGSKMGSPSIAAVVASRDDDFQQYPARLRCQWNRTEMIEDLEDMMVEHLHAYAAKNKKLPKQIIFYRDGVSEGEFKAVRTKEHAGIVRAFAKVYQDEREYPKLLLLCVVKRSSARFYPHSKQADPKGNSWPGLVVDTAVTSTTYYDFYLQSHKSLQGTAKPAHYVVLIDEIGVKPNTLQKLTYWQCYTFGRSLQAISAHPAARLADRACARGRAYLRDFLIDESNSDSGSSLNKDEKMRQVYQAALTTWGKGVHSDLEETMYYI